jgi:hypothetical protein
VKQITKKSCFIVFVCILFSCLQEIDVGPTKFNEEVVLNGFLSPDSVFKVNLSWTQPLGSNAPPSPISDARVHVFENDAFLEELTPADGGIFSGSHRPVAGRRYRVEALIPGQPRVIAEDEMPAEDVADACFFALGDPGGYNARVRVKIPTNSPSHTYWFHFFVQDYEPAAAPTTRRQMVFYFTGNSIWLDNFNAIYDRFLGAFEYTLYARQNDEARNQAGVEIVFGGAGHDLFRHRNLLQADENQRLELHIVRASSAFDRYLKSLLTEFITTQLLDIPNPFSGSVKVYSNVTGGRGIWAAYTHQVVDVKDFPCP